MRARRTALARFIDLSAMWAICLAIWFYLMLGRFGRIYPALMLACACTAATLGLWALLRRTPLPLKRASAPPALRRDMCVQLAIMPRAEALDALAAWLRFSGEYPSCERAGDALIAAGPDGAKRAIALIQAWPDARTDAGELLRAWRGLRCALSGAGAPRLATASTADFTPEALALARELSLSAIPPQALCELMRASLPICGDARSPRARTGALRSLISRAHAGRFGAYALGLSVAGGLLGLSHFRAAGLACALMWLICAAQPRPPRGSAWP